MQIRRAEAADIPAMHRVRLAVRENRLTRSIITLQDYHDHVCRDGQGWVAEIDGALRGFAVVRHADCNVWALFVEPGFEGRGIGRALHAALLDGLRAAGCASAWLVTAPGTRAAAFYREAGWQLDGVTGDGELRFTRELRPG